MKNVPVASSNAPPEGDSSDNALAATEDLLSCGAEAKPDKTETRRQRSLRAIIDSSCKRPTPRRTRHVTGLEDAAQRTQAAAPRSARISARADATARGRDARETKNTIFAQEKEMNTAEDASNQHIFTQLTSGTQDAEDNHVPEESDQMKTIVKWLASFRKQLREMVCDDRGTLCDAYWQLLFYAHPELTSFASSAMAKDESPQSGSSRRSTRRSAPPKPAQGLLDEWDPFYLEMGQWVDRIGQVVSKEPLTDQALLWEQARLKFINRVMHGVLEALKASAIASQTTSGALDSFTGGVSFVKESESHQIDVSDAYARLPPIIIQPPNLKCIQTSKIAEMVKTVISEDVLLVRMPDRDDSVIKEYLLNGQARRSLLRSTSGASCRVIKGLESVYDLIGDHIFLCFHYYMDQNDGSFKACVDTKKTATCGIDASNVQLTIVVRKGIGGTWALRNAARALDACQMLQLLSGSRSLNEMDFGSDLYRSLSESGRKRSCLSPSGSLSNDDATDGGPSCVRSVSVMTRLKAEKKPLIRVGTVSEWFASVQSTATQIMNSASQHGALQSPRQGRCTRQASEGARASSSRNDDAGRRDKREKATTEFMQKTLKRRLPSSSNTLPANVKIHSLSFRLEMFVKESLWKSLDKTQRRELHSVVLGVEQWLHDRIQNWNRDRMMNYGRDMVAIVKERTEELEEDLPQLSQRDVELSPQCPKEPHATAETSADASALHPETGIDRASSSLPETRAGENNLAKLLQDAPTLPPDPDCLSAGIVKTSAVASSIEAVNQPDIPWPYYLINTRDCFTYDLVEVKRKICLRGKQFIRTDFFFHPDQVPSDYGTQRNVGAKNSGEAEREILPMTSYLGQEQDWVEIEGFSSEPPEGAVPVGVTTFSSLFNHEELKRIEEKADEVHENSKIGMYPPECFHPTIGKNGTLKRTKYFFGARYLWTKEQLAERDASMARGVRVDVPPNPLWMKELVENSLTDLEIIPEGFINSWALNMYHDGSEGIQSHFDDSQRFCQPIYSMRLFSDSRLSFGTQLYGFTNGAFYVPMPRGCITIMHDKSYAANAVKHCVRPSDMSGKSASLIMRKINEEAWKEAVQYNIDEVTDWLASLHIDSAMSTNYSSEKRKGAHDAAKELRKAEAQVQADVKNVMEGLLKSVTRNASQEEMTEKKLRKIENRVSRQVMDSLIRAVEGMEKQAQKEKKLQQQELVQVRSVVENMIKKVEKNMTPPKRKRRETPIPMNFELRSKREKHTDDVTVTLESESVILAANRILEKVMGKKSSHVVQSACALLKEYGPAWIQERRQNDSESHETPSRQEQNSTDKSALLATSHEKEQVQQTWQTSQMTVPIMPEATIPDSYSMMLMQAKERGLTSCAPGIRTPVLEQSFITVPDGSASSSIRGSFASFAVGPHKYSLVPTEVLSPPLVPSVPVLPMTTRRTRSSSREQKRQLAYREQTLKLREKSEEQKKLIGGLLEAVLKQATHALPEWQTDHAGLPNRPSGDLSEDILRQLAEETESVDIESLYSHSMSSFKLEESVSRDVTKRTYKLFSSDICFVCEKSGINPGCISRGHEGMEPGSLWVCRGKCRRSFHYECLQSIEGHCQECATGEHKCFQCGDGANHLGSVLKCSIGICGKYYHLPCVMQIPETNVLQGSWMPVGSVAEDTAALKFRCPQHYCKTCGLSGANVFSVTCIRCPAAYHSKCRPDHCKQLSKKLIICPEHST